MIHSLTPHPAANLSQKNRIQHGFFTRAGGVSTGIYAGLNCGQGSNDVPEHVQENLKRVQGALNAHSLHTLYQIHSNICITRTPDLFNQRPEADAQVTDIPGIALGILTADCAPVLFYGEKADGSPVIGAAHAGWKGAIGGVLHSTVAAMSALGAEKPSIRAAIGPCIARASYEVSQDFLTQFLEKNPEWERFFTSTQKKDHYLFDLAGFCATQLQDAGVTNVFIADLDTYRLEGEFFSYRRKTHRNEPDYGRQLSGICILP